MPMVPTEPPAVQASSVSCSRVETVTNPSGGRLKVCVHICAHHCFSILGYDPGSQQELGQKGANLQPRLYVSGISSFLLAMGTFL